MKNHEKEDYSCKTLKEYAPECSFQTKKLVNFYKSKEQFSSNSVDYLEEISGKPKNPRTKYFDARGKEHIEWEWEELPLGFEKNYFNACVRLPRQEEKWLNKNGMNV